MFNQVTAVGRLGRDPETRYTSSGKAVANFSIATDIGYGDKKQTEWINIVVWQKLAEICQQYLHKGDLIFIQGRLQTRKWEDKNGTTRYTTEMVGETMKMLDTKGKETTAAQGSAAEISEEDIPF